tara:strand:- start:262 stop:537 length:276 start_codon:yes stop_codon:yes gene_type:complete
MNNDLKKTNGTENEVVAKVIIHVPSQPEISFLCPLMFELPKEGQILDIDYEKFLSDQDQWASAQSTLENNVMVIDRIEGNHVYLREGNAGH